MSMRIGYEDWNVTKDFVDIEVEEDAVIVHPTLTEEYTISIVNDFYTIPLTYEVVETGEFKTITEYEPLHYWVEDGVGTISDFIDGTYEDCVNWIKNNFKKSEKKA